MEMSNWESLRKKKKIKIGNKFNQDAFIFFSIENVLGSDIGVVLGGGL